MSEALVLNASGIEESSALKERKAKFMTAGVAWFAEEKGLSFYKAYRYGQTLPREVVVEDLVRICSDNGGEI